ncbi:DUF262 domain-containing protein [Mucilaginibacter sp. RS28]|uniref:DUF262 domain-containing protein n=1 Tax=Mucilaginibacter straminoryzae TaxID=2932774 RepID=A0A9X2B8S7_9SPHI|nr:DUF262 domain-containing protein [Mucilaginibacter straminoryzae]MCJ8209939.1 DUF262 domain-containing protein [Mucilaginibacter straminoryzae]
MAAIIELAVNGNDTLLLVPVRNDEEGNNNIFSLIDEHKKSWMELQLSDRTLKVISSNPNITEDNETLYIKLDKLVLDIIEAEQSGTENSDTSITEEANPYDPDLIKVNSKQFSVKLIDEMINNKDIDLNPDFQRNYVWTSLQKSRLIESILLRIPLPMFYFAEERDGLISVVDGLQRLTTIKEFMDNKFPLKNLEYLKDTCEGRYYTDHNGKKGIDPKYFRWFNMTQFSVNVIDPSSPAKVKYDIFRRINTGGKPLNNQEIRNCLASKALRTILKQMAELEEFKTATDRSIKPTRMDDQEIALRFILFLRLVQSNKTIDNYNGYMDSSLDELTDELSKHSTSELEHFVSSFSNAMKNAEYLFGSRFAFRKVTPVDLVPGAYKQLINKALFVCWSVLLSQYDYEKVKQLNEKNALLQPLAESIKDDRNFWMYLSYGTNSKANLVYAFKQCNKLLKQHLNN